MKSLSTIRLHSSSAADTFHHPSNDKARENQPALQSFITLTMGCAQTHMPRMLLHIFVFLLSFLSSAIQELQHYANLAHSLVEMSARGYRWRIGT